MAEGIPGCSTVSLPVVVGLKVSLFLNQELKMVKITDKTQIKGGVDYTFVCSKIPFAVSCSSDLPHQEHNLMDLDLVIKMKIPLKNIKVSRMNLMGRNVRAVGFINQTVQCVHQGKISGTINLQAKVVRNLYEMFDVDCIASSKTYERLVGRKPPPVPDDDTMDTEEDDDESEEGDEDKEDDDEKEENDKDEEDDNPTEAVKDEDDKPSAEADKDEDNNGYKYVECNWDDFIDRNPYDEASLYPGEPIVFGDSDDEDYETAVIKISDRNYASVKVPRPKTPSSPAPRKPSGTKRKETFCKYCFLSGQPISVTYGHNIMDVTCPSMSDEDKERIHGPNWLPKMYGYYDD